jgi:tripartite-type tricarboxylate transporter receptor subunit TctC
MHWNVISAAPAALAILLGLGLALPAGAQLTGQAYPWKPIRFVVSFPPGGVSDRLGRLLSQHMQESWGQPVVVENRPGGSGFIASQAVATAAPDGHTLLLGNINTHAINSALFQKLPYDPVKDFAPISLLVSVPNFLLVHPSVPASSVQELVALARVRPGSLTYASAGSGTSTHMSAELLKSMSGIDIVHVPYKGPAPALQAILAGEVNLYFETVASSLQLVRAGRLKVLAITSAVRSTLAPEVPTVAESGMPGFEVAPWFGALTRAGTPSETVMRLNAEMIRILNLPDVRSTLAAQGVTVIASTPDAFSRYVDQEIARWSKVVKETGARPD